MDIKDTIQSIYEIEGNKRFLRTKSAIHNHTSDIQLFTRMMPSDSTIRERVDVIRNEFLPLYDASSDLVETFNNIFVNESGKINSPMFKSKHATMFLERFAAATAHINTTVISQKWYHLKNDIKMIPLCPTCAETLPWTDQGYKQFCSQRCWTKSDRIAENTRTQFKGKSFLEQGREVSENLHSYGIHGKFNNIHFRSADELIVMMYYMSLGYTVESAENTAFSVQYTDPVTNMTRTYYPDLYIKEINCVIEVKPEYQLEDLTVLEKFNALKNTLTTHTCMIVALPLIQQYVDKINITHVDDLIRHDVISISDTQYQRLRNKHELKIRKRI